MRRNYTNYVPFLICIDYILASAQVYISTLNSYKAERW